MKNIALGLLGALLLTSLAACSGEGNENVDASGSAASQSETASAAETASDVTQILSVRQVETGDVLMVGDDEAAAKKIIGRDEGDTMIYFETDGIVRQSYDAEGISLDWLDGEIVAMSVKNPDWAMGSGARIGMTKNEIRALYADIRESIYETETYLAVAYDKELHPIPFTRDAYYLTLITFEGEGGVADDIALKTKIAEEKAAQSAPQSSEGTSEAATAP